MTVEGSLAFDPTGAEKCKERHHNRMRELSIAIFDASLSFSGFQRDSTNLAVGFSRLGKAVDLLLARKDAEECYWELPRSVRVIEFETRRSAHALWPLVRYLRRTHPHVLISTSTEANIIAYLAAKLAGVGTRVVVREAAMSLHRDPRPRGRLVTFLAKRLYPRTDHIIAISAALRVDLNTRFGLPTNRITVIYNPTVTPQLLQRAKQPVEHEWFAPGSPPVILGAGRLSWHKDFPTLMRAFRLVRRELPSRLMILGEGEDRGMLTTLAADLGISGDVALPGFVSNPFSYMARAALFVLSSTAEAFGHVLAESLACGTPVVSTNCPGGPVEILDSGRYGMLVPVGDEKEMAKAMLATLENPPPARFLQQATERFSCEVIAARYLELEAFRQVT